MKYKKYIPNILSGSRLLSPLILTPLILVGNYMGAIIALSLFLLTDAFDGFLARKWHVESELGAKIDAVADKTILLSLLLPIVISKPFYLITLILEGSISSINVVRKFKGYHPKTVPIGRIKMIMISLLMGLNYLDVLLPSVGIICQILFVITTALQIMTGKKYFDNLKNENKKMKQPCNQINLNTDSLNEKKENVISNSQNLVKLDLQKRELENLKNDLLQNNSLSYNQVKVKSLLKKKDL